MKVYAFVAVLAVASTPILPLRAADLPLPAAAVAALERARTPEHVAATAARHPGQAATIMAEAAALGLAAPASVVAVLAQSARGCADLRPWILHAAKAAPLEADITAVVTLRTVPADLAGCAPVTIAAATVDGIEAVAKPPDEITAEAAEIAVALSQHAAGSENEIAQAIAAATDTPSDSAATVLATVAAGIETANTRSRGLDRAQSVTPIDLYDLPNSARNKASPN